MFYRSTCNHELCIYNAFKRHFLLRHIVISKVHLQPYIWVVLSLFQKATCSDLVFSRVLYFLENSTCNCSCFQRWRVSFPFQLQATIKQMKRRSCRKEISQLSNMVPPWFQVCLNWNIACYLTTSVAKIRLFYLPLFPGSTWSSPLCQGHCVYSQHLFPPFIKATWLWLIEKNLKGNAFVCRKSL